MAYLIVCITDRNHINALARCQTDVPVVFWYTCDDMIVGEFPMGTDMAVLYPDICILFSEGYIGFGILYKDTWMRLAVEMHDLALIVHQILNTQC